MKKNLLQAAGILIVLTGLTSTRTQQRANSRLHPEYRPAAVSGHHPGFRPPGTALLIELAMQPPQKHRRSIKAYNPVAEPLLPGGGLSDPD